ncbi:hypothetical protein ACFE04_025010 [Oxalis oulophora]
MACNSLFSCSLTRAYYNKPSGNPSVSTPFLSSSSVQYKQNTREISLPSVASIPYQPINVDYLEEEFSGHGVTFEGIGEYCVTKMKLHNGSTATLMLPSALITSYKAKMWHGGTMELLQTNVTKGEGNVDAKIEGGVSLDLKIETDGEETSWYPRTWALHDVKGNSKESIQIEMISSDSAGMIELRYLINLEDDTLTSELVVSNSKASSLRLTGSLINHLTVSTPEATYVTGLEGSDFCTKPPFMSHFSINLPENYQMLGTMLSNTPLNRLVTKEKNSGQSENKEEEKELEGEEDDNYKHLAEEMSRIYTSAPRYFTVLDRGRRNSLVVGREGLDELYLYSPGSSYEFYSNNSYICIGQSALLKPIIVGPGEIWRGGQKLHNPNESY